MISKDTTIIRNPAEKLSELKNSVCCKRCPHSYHDGKYRVAHSTVGHICEKQLHGWPYPEKLTRKNFLSSMRLFHLVAEITPVGPSVQKRIFFWGGGGGGGVRGNSNSVFKNTRQEENSPYPCRLCVLSAVAWSCLAIATCSIAACSVATTVR